MKEHGINTGCLAFMFGNLVFWCLAGFALLVAIKVLG